MVLNGSFNRDSPANLECLKIIEEWPGIKLQSTLGILMI